MIKRLRLPPSFKAKILVTDIDGVMTDGTAIFGLNGEEYKVFNYIDGQGLAFLKDAGVKLAGITREDSAISKARLEKLCFDFIYIDIKDKLKILKEIQHETGISFSNFIYVGDDFGDLEVMSFLNKNNGITITPKNGTKLVKNIAQYTTFCSGGRGAIREICEEILGMI